MKIMFSLLLFSLIYGTVHSQKKLEDGIYLIDQSKKNIPTDTHVNKAMIQFNYFFVDENPEDYEPIPVLTDDYVPLELASLPDIRKGELQRKVLTMQLSQNATKKLTAFTAGIPEQHVVVVVNGEALAVYKIMNPPVTVGLIQISRCRGSGCDQIYSVLKRKIEASGSLTQAF